MIVMPPMEVLRPNPMQLRYPSRRPTERYCALLDILGVKGYALAAENDPDKLASLIGAAFQLSTSWAGLVDEGPILVGPRVDSHFAESDGILTTGFSDSLLLSAPAESVFLDLLLRHVRDLVNRLLLRGFLIRGAVTKGPLLHEGRVAVGPALVRAHLMEQNIAKVPRIVLDDATAADVRAPIAWIQMNPGHDIWLRRSPNGVTWLDTLRWTPPRNWNKGELNRFDPSGVVPFLRQSASRLSELAREACNMRVTRKIQWYQAYHRAVCSDLQIDLNCEPGLQRYAPLIMFKPRKANVPS